MRTSYKVSEALNERLHNHGKGTADGHEKIATEVVDARRNIPNVFAQINWVYHAAK